MSLKGRRTYKDLKKTYKQETAAYPRHTFQTCPVCGYRPMTRHAGRVLSCPRRRFSHDRDVIACMNILKRYVNEGHVSLEV
ncbi:MAG: transposase [Desulfurococcales archaeon]|nr:transposase [Desulfurococcales archaeon]